MKKNIVIINRWTAVTGFTDFETYIDHAEYCVHYIVTEASRDAIHVPPDQMGSFCLIREMELQSLSSVLRSIVAHHGRIDRLIAMAEKDLLVAGQLRDMYGIEGQTYEEARRFVDKAVMKEAIEKSGIVTPGFKELSDGSVGLRFPLILKPKRESSSRGVIKITCEAHLQEQASELNTANYLIEEFCDGPVYHLDGFVYKGRIIFQASHQYVGTCLDHAQGKPLASVQITDPQTNRIFQEFANQVVRALNLQNGSFHLECFLREATPIFLEIAARAGGGDIREMLKLAHDFDIVKAWIDTQLEKCPLWPSATNGSRSAGFLIFPGPAESKTLEKASSYGITISCLRKEYIFPTGHVFSGSGDIFSNSIARFIFVGRECEIRSAIEHILSNFKVDYRCDLGEAM